MVLAKDASEVTGNGENPESETGLNAARKCVDLVSAIGSGWNFCGLLLDADNLARLETDFAFLLEVFLSFGYGLCACVCVKGDGWFIFVASLVSAFCCFWALGLALCGAVCVNVFSTCIVF